MRASPGTLDRQSWQPDSSSFCGMSWESSTPEPELPDAESLARSYRYRIEPKTMAALVGALIVVALVAWYGLSRGGSQSQLLPTTVSATGSVAIEPIPSGGASTAPLRGSAPSPSPTSIVVDVIGPVRRPGVVSLPSGARVADAIAAAGGLIGRRSGAATHVNLARVLQDGEQVDAGSAPTSADAGVGGPRATGNAGSSGGSGANTGSGISAGSGGSKIDLNTATLIQLDQLPRVGPVTAQKIIDFRESHGGYRSVEQLQEIAGIGERTFAQLEPLVQVDPR